MTKSARFLLISLYMNICGVFLHGCWSSEVLNNEQELEMQLLIDGKEVSSQLFHVKSTALPIIYESAEAYIGGLATCATVDKKRTVKVVGVAIIFQHAQEPRRWTLSIPVERVQDLASDMKTLITDLQSYDSGKTAENTQKWGGKCCVTCNGADGNPVTVCGGCWVSHDCGDCCAGECCN